MLDIVATFECVLGKRAIFDEVDRGAGNQADVKYVLPLLERAGVRFDEGYLERVLRKYYG